MRLPWRRSKGDPVRWGVLGPGGIAGRFARAMSVVDGGTIVAVGSRSSARADAFGDEHGVARRYGSYDDLLADDEVDVVYVASPHSHHEVHTLAALAAGKHVLCEKAFALDAGQGARMVAAARASGLFLMEAMWSRFLPAYRRLVSEVEAGRIGAPLLVEADFGFRRSFDAEHRLFDLAQGGGALLDLGIYPLQLCALVLGVPTRVVADGVVGPSGADEVVAAVLHHRGDGLGLIKASTRVNLSCAGRVAGTDGWIELPPFMHCPSSLTIGRPGAAPETIETPFEHDGIRFEIDEVHRCLAAGLLESPTMALDESVALLGVMDEIRAQLGVVYPSG